MDAGRTRYAALAALAVAAGLWLASDGRHHWDEPTYLYAGAYVPAQDIVAGQVQPSGIGHFTQGRILHALLVKVVMSVAPSPPAGFAAMIAFNLVLLAASALLLHRLLRGLLPGLAATREAALLVVLSPVVLYLGFRVLADAEALFTGLLATYALLRLAQGGSLRYAALAAVALTLCTLSKNQMTWMPATFWASFCLVPVAGIDRRRLAVLGAASGIAAVVLTLATLAAMGIGLEAYWSSYRALASGSVPPVAKLLSVVTELGVLWLLLPFAVLSVRRRELAALALWCALAMAPFVLVINSIEARHVAANLAAVGGLFALALEALAVRSAWLGRAGGRTRSALAIAAVAVLLATDAVVLAIMPHRIDLPQMRAALAALDARFGTGNYLLLTATGYTDFHMIRVLRPELDVRDPSTDETFVHPGGRTRREALEAWYQGREVGSIDALRDAGKPVAYLGYRQTFAAENLHGMLSHVSPSLAARAGAGINLPDRLFPPATAWLWDGGRVSFEPIAQVGHYHTFEVRFAVP